LFEAEAHFMGGLDTRRARAATPPIRTRNGLEEIVFAGEWGVPALE
jgi:hypothetical protein